MRKSIKNYTTSISASRSIAGIQEMLAVKGAHSVMINYQNSEPIGMAFAINTPKGMLPIQLPARTEKVEAIFLSNKKLSRRNRYGNVDLSETERQQAKRTAWKNLYDWIDAQLALLETEMAKMEEIFLPYVVWNGHTVFDHFESGNLLSDGKN